MIWRLCFILSASFLFRAVTAIYNSEKDAEIFLKESSIRQYRLYDEISNITYNIDDKLFFGALEERGMSQNIATLMLDITKEAKKYKTYQFDNPNVIKGIQKLRSADLFVLEEDFFNSLSTSLLALQKIATDKDICNYTQRNKCNMAYLPDIRKVFTNSMDPNELLYYWQELRQKQGSLAKNHLNNLVELFRKAAYSNGLSVRRFWFRTYEDLDFFTDMESAMHEIQPFYLEFHAYIRRELSKKYGSAVIDQTGPIPDHIVEQVMLQAWKKQGILSDSFPRQRLPNLKEGLESQGFDIGKTLKNAEDFYESLGFSAIPDKIKNQRFKEIPQAYAGKDCKTDIFDKTPKVYMKYCKTSPSFKRFLQTHGSLGRIYYAMEKKDLPFYFFPSFDLEYPLGEAVILSASTPNHMNRAEILNNFNYTNELSMNRLFRMGVHTIFNIAQYFVNTKVVIDVLEGQVPIQLINQHYWKLMDEYAGIEPPVDRTTKSIDFSYKFFDDLSQNHQTRKFVSEILGYKMYESFCLKTGGFVPNDPNKPLHECDFYGNKDVGTAMRKMMKVGSTTTWRTAIAQIVPDSAPLSADSLLKYYKPLHEWLKEKNRLAGTVVGWTPSRKNVR
ncbi:angiotensin-converting enzyme-like [Eupeodes corollae]|uniref:angiotensin-converting enzyme-like n=1 Tax=Eupeodes corollae TaxID=290404 RepID=UPI00249069DE|nr:angiotensin-converting enzyme-like [Eupeodes corollae]